MTLSPWTAKLREWQARAVSSVLTHTHPDFLATATPAAGKTRFALRIAHQYLADRVASRVLVICPTNHLRTQWATAAGLVGVDAPVVDRRHRAARAPARRGLRRARPARDVLGRAQPSGRAVPGRGLTPAVSDRGASG